MLAGRRQYAELRITARKDKQGRVRVSWRLESAESHKTRLFAPAVGDRLLKTDADTFFALLWREFCATVDCP
jgi:hypothetical protein